jgi:hypothetical protein
MVNLIAQDRSPAASSPLNSTTTRRRNVSFPPITRVALRSFCVDASRLRLPDRIPRWLLFFAWNLPSAVESCPDAQINRHLFELACIRKSDPGFAQHLEIHRPCFPIISDACSPAYSCGYLSKTPSMQREGRENTTTKQGTRASSRKCDEDECHKLVLLSCSSKR